MRLVDDLRQAIRDSDVHLTNDLLRQIDAALDGAEAAVRAVDEGKDAYPSIGRVRAAIDRWPTERMIG